MVSLVGVRVVFALCRISRPGTQLLRMALSGASCFGCRLARLLCLRAGRVVDLHFLAEFSAVSHWACADCLYRPASCYSDRVVALCAVGFEQSCRLLAFGFHS